MTTKKIDRDAILSRIDILRAIQDKADPQDTLDAAESLSRLIEITECVMVLTNKKTKQFRKLQKMLDDLIDKQNQYLNVIKLKFKKVPR